MSGKGEGKEFPYGSDVPRKADVLPVARHAPRTQCRRGSALLVVLSLLAITLTVSYAMIRSQVTSVQVQANHNRQALARQAAMSGIAAGLRRMHDADWPGVTTVLGGQLGDNVSYSLTYATGDPSLSSGDADHELFPFRVTLTSTGTATDPGDVNVNSIHRVQVVVQLTPRQLSPGLADWDKASPYTFYQWKTNLLSLAEIEIPVRIEGKVRFQSTLRLCVDDPEDDSARKRLLGDLRASFQQGSPDQRPFDGQIDLPTLLTDWETRQLLTQQLGLTLNDVWPDNDFEPDHPNGVSEYQLYPGGAVYQIPTFAASAANESYEPDPVGNPLGIYRRTGQTYVQDNVSIQGTVIIDGSTSADLDIDGQNVSWTSYRLPVTLEDNIPIELPCAYVVDDLEIGSSSTATLSGVFSAGDDFEVKSGGQDDISFQLNGHLLCRDLMIRGRDQWERSESWWKDRLDEFLDQLQDSNPISLFPDWLEQIRGLDPQPRITIRPRTEQVHVHWMSFQEPLFVPHDDDEGLLWEIVTWKDLE